jgi:hypothetical protein
MMTKLMYLAKHNLFVPLHRNNFMDHDDPKTRVCALYLELLAKASKYQPDSDEIHLIEQTNKIDVYYDMLEVWKATHQLSELPSLDLSYQVWRTQFPHLKNPKNCCLDQCDIYADLQVKFTKARGQIHQQLLTKWQKHKADICLERKKMDELLDRGHTDPGKLDLPGN